MTERNIGRPWTEEEDQLLKDAVVKHGEHDNWKNIALCIPGRTNKACRKRWLHSLSPDLKKTAWTPEEDKLLMDLYDKHGAKWSTIARSIPGRTDDACSKRYREALDPSLKKDEWTPEEDAKLLQVFGRIGGKWGQIGQEMQRSGLGCRNRWRLLERKKAAALRAGAQVVASSSTSVASSQDSSSSPSAVLPNDRTLSPLEQSRTLPSSSKSSPAPSSTRVALPVEGPATDTHRTNSSRSQSGSVVDMWPPYFPPESYPIHGPSFSPSHSFRVPSPQLVPVSPNIAPFQFSSSSLSTALSAPPQLPRPLPPVSNEPPLMALELDADFFSSTDTQSTEQLLENDDALMPLDDPLLSVATETVPPPMEHFTTALLPPVFTPPLLQQSISLHPQHQPIPISPTSQSNDIPIQIDRYHVPDIWKSPGPLPLIDFLSPLLEQSPQSTNDNNLPMDANFDDFSSTSSTPCLFSSSLSATSSPNVSSPVDLPCSEQSGSSTGSLLFSTSREPMRSFQPARSRRPIPNKLLKTGTPMRLSSSLPLTADPSIKPYACGTEACWPPGATTSRSCFTTSKELFDHNKAEHADDTYTEKPYRCALAGCGKSWKSINGLQYHLQISTAHFRTALSSRFSTQSLNEEAGSGTEPEVDENEREFVCPVPNCFKAYKHSSGLRYHMKHGHPQNLPVQFLEVPPTLARQIPIKAKRMRRKARSEEL